MRNIVCLILFLAFVSNSFGQEIGKEQITKKENSPVHKLLILHRSSVVAELNQLQEYLTPNSKKVQNKRFEFDITQREIAKLAQFPPESLNNSDCEYGEYLIKKITVETELRNLLSNLTISHPLVIEKVKTLSEIERKISTKFKYKEGSKEKNLL